MNARSELADRLTLQLHDGPLTLIKASATINIAREYYFGHQPIHLRGFKDEKDGSVVTKKFSIEEIEPWSIERGLVKGWRKLDDPELLAVKPMMYLGYSDVVPETMQSDDE